MWASEQLSLELENEINLSVSFEDVEYGMGHIHLSTSKNQMLSDVQDSGTELPVTVAPSTAGAGPPPASSSSGARNVITTLAAASTQVTQATVSATKAAVEAGDEQATIRSLADAIQTATRYLTERQRVAPAL